MKVNENKQNCDQRCHDLSNGRATLCLCHADYKYNKESLKREYYTLNYCSEQVSLNFARRAIATSDLVGILFDMKIDPSIPSTPFANVHDVSYFQGEEEILFSMNSIFRIGPMKQLDGNNRLWQVDLILTSDNDQDLHILTEQMRKEIHPDKKGWDRLGQLLIKLGQFNKAEEVYDILLEQTTIDLEKASMNHMLGIVKHGQGEYKDAITYYKRSIKIEEKMLSPTHANFVASYNGIGLVYAKIGDYSNALSYHQKALEINQKALPSSHSHLAMPYNNIGMVYHKMGDYSNALSYHQKALEINQKALPSNHPDLATSYSNIGMVYHKMGDYSNALSYYQKALEIYQKALPSNHPDLATSYNNIEVAGQIVLYNYHHGKPSIQEIKEKINNDKPDRIIIIINEKNSSKLIDTINDHLLIPLYVAQATTTSYSPIPVLLLTCISNDNNLNIIQNATDQLINIYSHIVNAKLLTPVNDEDINENYFESLWTTNPEELHHITVLSDILPILLALIHDGKVNGQINICNKGTISLKYFKTIYSNEIKQENILPQSVPIDDITDKFEQWNKQMISPETRQLYQASFLLPNVLKSIEQILQQQKIHMNRNTSKILLVTGGCGFIGSTFINHWIETYPNDKIINIDRLDPVANMKNISNPNSPNYTFILADINNKDIVLHLFNQYNITHIVHFAVQAHLDSSFGNSITFTESNVYGTHSVLEASRIYGKIQKFIHISTDEVYGETPSGSNQEICLLNPLNPYAATIAAAEFLVKSYGESFKLPYCIIRLCNVYGPRQHFEKVIPTFINTLLHGEKIKIHGDGKQIRHFLYVDDVIHAIEIILNKGKTKMIYNIGTKNELNVLDIAKYILEKLQLNKNLDDVIIYVKPRSFSEKRYCTTICGLVKSLGWKEEISFDQGLEKTIEWLQLNPDYWTK
ncbi:unnamed protein product [Rotaria sp. Silwood1]|nr:unnamed protein product [Rotaria sp. Silwood1]CAF1498398.1 unnamed protein product [Rotaria sp. Silwood1]